MVVLRALPFVFLTLGCAARVPPPPPEPRPVPRVSTRAPLEKALPVAAPKRPVVHSFFGTNVSDDYEWLEDGTNADVLAFTEAQNALARRTLDALPERTAIRTRLTALSSATSPDWRNVVSAGGRLFALKEEPPKQQPILVDLGALGKISERVVVDPNVIDPSGKTTIDFFVPSPDGRAVAVSLSSGGSESGDLHVFDVASGKDRNETIARVNGGTAGGSVAWTTDGFFYTRYPRAGERAEADLDFYQQVYFHKLGAAEASDTLALGKTFPRIAETTLERGDDGRIVATVENGDGGEFEHHVWDGAKWTRLSRFEDALTKTTFGADGRLYAVSRKGAPRGKVVAFASPFTSSVDVVAEGDAVIDDMRVTKTAIYTIEVVDGPSRVRRFPLAARAEPLAREPAKGKKPAPLPTTIEPGARGVASAVLPLPPVTNVAGAVRVGEDLLLRVESYVEAPRWLVYRASEHRFATTALAKKAAYDTSDVEVARETCVSKDGTKVPLTVLLRRGAKRDGSMPGLLTGYGGFGITVRPRMRVRDRVWLDNGGVVAEANLRGGGERGKPWHGAGSLTKKQNVFDDFAACAQTLFDRRYTAPERLAITGRSNGGLLVGAALVQHPEMFRAVGAVVGIYDMLRNERTANGAFNVAEFGSVTDEAQFRALYGYSPFHRVADGVSYPAALFMTGQNDPRVDPFHSRKMVARLQAATSSNRPIVLRSSGDTGHGSGTPLAAEIEETTDLLAFLLHEVTH